MATTWHRRWPIPALIGMLWLAACHARAEATLDVSADRRDIFLGETVNLQVRVWGVDDAAEPDFSDLRDCTVERRGKNHEFDMFRGTRSVTFAYVAKPERAGELELGPVRAEAAGLTLTARGPIIRVRGDDAQDWVSIEVGASRESVVVDEYVDVDVSIRIRALPPPYDNHDPLDPGNPPHLDVPFVTAPAGLTAPPVEPYLQQYVVQRRDQPGFTLNDTRYQIDPIMNFMNFNTLSDQMVPRFRFPRRTLDLPGGRFHVYDFKLTFRARKEGTYAFGPVEFKGHPITEVGPGGQPRTTPVLARSPGLSVRVTPPPAQGRPPSFVGAVGSNLTATAALDAQTCNVGDPLTLTLDIHGDIGLDNLTAPNLSQQPAITEYFRVYDDTVRSESRENGRTYRYTIRPTQAGTYELPPIAISYYDSLAGAYRTVETGPIPIRANESAQVTGAMIVSSATNAPISMTFSGTSDTAAPAPITMDPGGAVSAPLLRWHIHGVIGLFGPLALGLTLVARGTRRTLRHVAEQAHPRDARRAAEAALARAGRETDPATRATAVRAALTAYLAARLRIPGQGLTPDDTRRLLAAIPSVPPELTARVHALDERLFLARFSGSATAAGATDAVAQARELLRELDPVLGTRPSRAAPRRLLLLPFLIGTLAASAAGAREATDASARFMWDRANARLAAAQVPADFAASARLYQELIRAGVRSGPLFYNAGVAELESDRPAEALRAFLRAERYLGARPEIRRNIACALEAATPDNTTSLLPTYRILLFWHYGLGLSLRMAIALGGVSLMLLAAAMRIWNWRGLAPPVLSLGVLLLVVFGTSVGASLHAESVDDLRMRTAPPPTHSEISHASS